MIWSSLTEFLIDHNFWISSNFIDFYIRFHRFLHQISSTTSVIIFLSSIVGPTNEDLSSIVGPTNKDLSSIVGPTNKDLSSIVVWQSWIHQYPLSKYLHPLLCKSLGHGSHDRCLH